MKFNYKTYQIEILRDQNFTLNSTDNLINYQNIYYSGNKDDDRYIAKNKIAIKIFENNKEINSALLCEIGNNSGISEKSIIVENDNLWICISDKIYSLEIPSLKLNWNKQIDYSTNFTINKLENNFLIHGELEIIRITKSGEIVWRFGGRDIWVNLNGRNEFVIESNRIKLVDFDNNEYTINFEGKEI